MDQSGNPCDFIMASRKYENGRSARGTEGSHHLSSLGIKHPVSLWAAKCGSCL